MKPSYTICQEMYSTGKRRLGLAAVVYTMSVPLAPRVYAHPHESENEGTQQLVNLPKNRTLDAAYFGKPLTTNAKRILEATEVTISKDLNPQLVYE
ncbi:MAG: hypothetical protein AABX37_02880, partial [Nanoarchaeota archaeon]